MLANLQSSGKSIKGVLQKMKNHLRNLIKRGYRQDGRDFLEYRPIKVEKGISSSAEGSARVTIGDTIVIAGVKMDIGEPFPDTPDKGVLIVNAELTPLSSPKFELGPPGIEAIELARVVDRGIRESNAIDLKKLCIKEGEKVWMVFVDIYPLNDDGNLFDAAALAAIAALQDTKIPSIKDDKPDYSTKGKEKLPLNCLPVEITIGNIAGRHIIDLTSEEEEVLEARLTVAIADGKICALQKGGSKELTQEEIEEMVEIALQKSKELVKFLK